MLAKNFSKNLINLKFAKLQMPFLSRSYFWYNCTKMIRNFRGRKPCPEQYFWSWHTGRRDWGPLQSWDSTVLALLPSRLKLKPNRSRQNEILIHFSVYFHILSDKSIFNFTWCFTYSNYPFDISNCSILFDHYRRWNCLWGWLDSSFNWFCNSLCCWFI